MAEEQKKVGPLRVQFLYPTDPLPIGHIHFVKFSQLGGEILMDLGTFDDAALIARVSGETAPDKSDEPISAFVTARFGMSPNTLGLIRSNVQQLWEKMEASGALKQLGLEDSGAKQDK